MSKTTFVRSLALVATVLAPAFFGAAVYAQAPNARAVPFIASDPTSPHTSWSGNPVILKGDMISAFCNANSSNNLSCTHSFTYDWNPGDGGSHCTGSVSNQHVIECAHTYTGSVGTVYTAVLTVTDTTNSTISPPANCPPSITQGACYYTSIAGTVNLAASPKVTNLSLEVNNAIDRGLWFIHKAMLRATSAYTNPSTSAVDPIGTWSGSSYSHANVSNSGGTGPNAIYCSALQVSGFTPTAAPANPYSDDAALCVAGVFNDLTTRSISTDSVTGVGNVVADQNSNGIAAEHNGYPVNYQTGMDLDAIIAAGTPSAIVPGGTNLGHLAAGLGRSAGSDHTYRYKDAIQDMVDDYAYCESHSGDPYTGSGGGWFYGCQDSGGDNSISQWAAIGIIPARRSVGSTIDSNLLVADQKWLGNSFNQLTSTQGQFGYSNTSPDWGGYADTAGGMVQVAMNGYGRGTTLHSYASNTNPPMWDNAETWMRDTFSYTGGGGSSLKGYYYGMFSFTKSMLLHDNSGTGLTTTPIQYLHSSDDPNTCTVNLPYPRSSVGSGHSPCYPDIDWYAAQSPTYGGTDPTEGVARTIVNDQQSDGSWFGQNFTSNQDYFQTASSIIMLNKTVFQALPVACFTANPNPVADGALSTLTSCSFDQDSSHTLTTFQWDVSGTGGTNFTISAGNAACLTPNCSSIKYTFNKPGAASYPYNYPVTLKVTDSASLTASTVGQIVIAFPPTPPTANAGGPYSFCPAVTPFTLDGSKSTNPDQGKNDGTTSVTSTIIAYDWDYSCSGAYNSAHGAQVDAASAFNQAGFYGSTFNVCLRVTNNDNLAFPTVAVQTDTSVASTKVTIHNPTDAVCTAACPTGTRGVAKAPTPGVPGSIQLYWSDSNSSGTPFDHYNIYRSTSSNFANSIQVAGANSNPFKSAVPVSATPGAALVFVDNNNIVAGTTYYYRIAASSVSDQDLCQSPTTTGVVALRGR